MRLLAAALIVSQALAFQQEIPNVSFQYLHTFGSKLGIHPPRLLNRRASTALVGKSEHPYGLGYPSAVTTDLKGRVWIADSGTVSVHVFDLASGAYREFKRCGETALEIPWGLASDRAGRVYLTDSGARDIFVFDEHGEFDHQLFKHKESPLVRPGAIALSEDQRTLYVADPPSNAILELNREGEVDSRIELPPELSDPSAIAVVDNQIWVTGAREHRVASFSPGGVPRGEFHWDGVLLPSAFAYDPIRRLFFVGNPRRMIVQAYDLEGKNVGAFGQMGAGVDQTERIDRLYADREGRVYVIDSSESKVLVFEAAQ